MFFLLSFPFLGERLEYVVKYGPFTAGRAWMWVEKDTLQGMEVYRIISEERTEGFFNLFFKVEDRYDSWVRVDSFCSCRFRKKIQEGRYKNTVEIEFGEEKVRYSDGREYPGRECMVDLLSSIYYVRLLPLEVGKTFYIPVHADEITGDLKIEVVEKERVRVPWGEFEAFRVKPVLPETKAFGRKGGLEMWYSDTPEHIPVKIKMRTFFGSLVFLLERRN